MSEVQLTPGDLETLAAFLDRRLTLSERQEFMGRLDREPELYEVFVDTVRYRESQMLGTAEVETISSGKTSWVIPATVAALLAVAVLGPQLTSRLGLPTGAGLARGLVSENRLEGVLAPDWVEQGWRRTRGLTNLHSEVDSAFRVGVHSMDLEVALRTDRRDDATLLLRYMHGELDNIDLSDHLQLSYSDLLRQLEGGESFENALAGAAEIEEQAAELLDIEYGFAFGRWAEAGKLAAQSGNQKLLRSRVFGNMLSEIQRHEWTQEVDALLAEVESEISRANRTPDLPALERVFTSIINES